MRASTRWAAARVAILGCALAVTAGAWAGLKATTPAKPVFVQVTLGSGEKLSGGLTQYDDDALTIKTGKGPREQKWSELAPASESALRAQLMEKKGAAEWLELAEIAMRGGLKEHARTAVTQAITLD